MSLEWIKDSWKQGYTYCAIRLHLTSFFLPLIKGQLTLMNDLRYLSYWPSNKKKYKRMEGKICQNKKL